MSLITVFIIYLSLTSAARLGLIQLSHDMPSLANLTKANQCFASQHLPVKLVITANHLTLVPTVSNYTFNDLIGIRDCLEEYPIKQVIRYNITLSDTLLASVRQSLTSSPNNNPPSPLSHNTGEQGLSVNRAKRAKRAFSDGEDDFGDQCIGDTDTPDTLSDAVSCYFHSSFGCSGCTPVCWNEIFL